MSGWQKRWFVSSGHYLTYYKNEQKKELLCSIDLEQVDVIQPNGMATHGMFQIQVKGGKLMNLRAPTGMEAVAWCDDLQTFSDHHAQTVDEIRDELRAYYQSRNPAKVDEVDAIMAQFEGREMEVVTMLQQAKLAEAQAAQAAGGGEAAAGEAVEAAAATPAGGQSVDSIRRELLAYYQSRNPAKATQVDAIMAQYAGREHEVVEMLRKAQAAEAQAQAQADEDDAAAAPPPAPSPPCPPPSAGV